MSGLKRFIRLNLINFNQGCLTAVLVILAGVCAVGVTLWFRSFEAMTLGIDIDDFSLGDNLALLLMGRPQFEFRPGVLFIPPLDWLLLFMICQFVPLGFSVCELTSHDEQILIRCQSRNMWWLSKCVWAMASVTFFCIAVLLTSTIWTFFMGQSMELIVHEESMLLSEVSSDFYLSFPVSILPFLAGCYAGVIALQLIQACLSLLLNPIVAYLTSAAMLMSASYVQSPLLTANLLSFSRYEGAVQGGVSFEISLGIALLFTALSLVCGQVYICRVDIMRKGRKQ